MGRSRVRVRVWRWLRLPLRVQAGGVVALFVAALAVLWTTWASVVERDARRTSARDLLDRAGEALARRGAGSLADAPRWPYAISQRDWDELDRRLTRESVEALRPTGGVEGGYYLPDFHKFLGTALDDDNAPGPVPKDEAKKTKDKDRGKKKPKAKKERRRADGPPPKEADLIENQAEAAIASNRVLFIVQDVPPSTVAIRTAPLAVGGRGIAATWTMTRLVDPLFLDRSIRGYRLAASLALGGIALSLVLTAGLARTIRRQAVERDRLQAELRRSERLAALGKLLAGVAHEVRNPLAGIRSTVQLWRRGIGPDDESYADLQAEVDRIEGIVARLLQFSRADAQGLAPGDLNAVVGEAARLARGAAEAGGVRVELVLDEDLPAVAMAPAALLQVFRNLTTNAIQAMPRGGRLRLTTRRAEGGRAVAAEVADDGPGLSPETLAHLFEPFHTTKPEGTGLGLAIAHEIALSHRGALVAENRPGVRGAVFRLVLPAARPAQPRDGDEDGVLDDDEP